MKKCDSNTKENTRKRCIAPEMQFVFLILLVVFFPTRAFSQTWPEIENVKPQQLYERFLRSIEMGRRNRTSGLNEYELKIRTDNDIMPIFIELKSKRNNELERHFQRIFGAYRQIMNKEIEILDQKGREKVTFYIGEKQDIEEKQRELESIGHNFGEIEKEYCSRSIVYDKDGKIYHIFSTIDSSLTGIKLRGCINTVVFHSFYFGSVFGYEYGKNLQQKVQASSQDFINIRIAYDNRVPFRISDLDGVNNGREIAKDAKLWFCSLFDSIECEKYND